MIREVAPRVQVVALTRHDDLAFVRLLLQAGANGYVLKQSASSELLYAIRRVAAGEQYIDASIRFGTPAADDEAADSALRVDADLTAEEEAVLRRIALGQTHAEIARALSIEFEQVLAHRASAMEKAGLPSRVAIVRYAQARGWLTPA
jgi:DNA-binding NarL/FixJ family response regulator